jgi:hypothetical protein
MEIEPPYNNSEIIHEITDIGIFLSDLKNDLDKNFIKVPSMQPLKKYNTSKYTDDFLKSLIIKPQILITVSLYLSKTEVGNFLINNKLYYCIVKEHLKYVYDKFLCIMVDDGYLNLYFENNEFVCKPIKKKRK